MTFGLIAYENPYLRSHSQEARTINGDLDQLYPNVNVPHGEILCYWLANDVDGKQLRIEAVLECGSKVKTVDTGIVYEKRLHCKDGRYVPARRR